MERSNEDIVQAIAALVGLIDNLNATIINQQDEINALRIRVRESERRQDKVLATYEARLEQAENRLEKLEARHDKLENQLDNLRSNQ